MHKIRNILLGLTLMLAGRAMTLAYIGRAGGGAPGDPPLGWLMPLIGDAVVGIAALPVAYLLWRKTRGATAWAAIIVWNAVALWDALSAYVVHTTTPWPSFFMVEVFGSSMFFMAAGMHGLCIGLAMRPDFRRWMLEP